jgi:hypothetical protein
MHRRTAMVMHCRTAIWYSLSIVATATWYSLSIVATATNAAAAGDAIFHRAAVVVLLYPWSTLSIIATATNATAECCYLCRTAIWYSYPSSVGGGGGGGSRMER